MMFLFGKVRRMQKLILSVMALSLLGCTTTIIPLKSSLPLRSVKTFQTRAQAFPQLKTGVPLYRVFRGVRRSDVAPEVFLKDLDNRFIPAAPKTHSKNGLVAYLPAIPPLNIPTGIPDEFAIVMYESPDVYQHARNTPEGKAYGDMHWEIFDRDKSKSVTAVSLESTNGQMVADTGYDVLQRPTDWQKGHSTFFVGLRLDSVPPSEFLPRLTQHVHRVKNTFGSMGLEGYIVVATENYEVAFMNWRDQTDADRAFATPEGNTIAAEAQGLMKPLQWATASDFKGHIQPGQVVNVKFQRRPPNEL